MWRIGVLRPAPDDPVFRKNFDPFLQALRELRFTEGTNLMLEYRVRAGNAQEMLALANDLVRAKVDAILAIAPAGVSAAAKATTSIPIVAVDLELVVNLKTARALSVTIPPSTLLRADRVIE